MIAHGMAIASIKNTMPRNRSAIPLTERCRKKVAPDMASRTRLMPKMRWARRRMQSTNRACTKRIRFASDQKRGACAGGAMTDSSGAVDSACSTMTAFCGVLALVGKGVEGVLTGEAVVSDCTAAFVGAEAGVREDGSAKRAFSCSFFRLSYSDIR